MPPPGAFTGSIKQATATTSGRLNSHWQLLFTILNLLGINSRMLSVQMTTQPHQLPGKGDCQHLEPPNTTLVESEPSQLLQQPAQLSPLLPVASNPVTPVHMRDLPFSDKLWYQPLPLAGELESGPSLKPRPSQHL